MTDKKYTIPELKALIKENPQYPLCPKPEDWKELSGLANVQSGAYIFLCCIEELESEQTTKATQ